MDCKDYEELLMQFAFNELSEEESEVLQDHLGTCEDCAAKLKKNQALYRLTQKLKETGARDEKKAESIRSILSALDPVPRKPARKPVPNRVLQWIVSTAAIFLVGLFLVQQVEMKQRLRSLDEKMNQPVAANPSSLKEFALPELTSLPEDRILLLLEEYEQLVSENQVILNYLLENHPEIYKKIKELSVTDKSSLNEL